MNRRVTSLSVKEKLEVLNDLKNDIDKRDLCAKYKINKSTLNRIIRNEEQIRNIVVTGKNINRKRQRNGLHGKVEKALGIWIKEIKESNAVLSQAMILDKAKELAIKFKEDFNPGLSWLYRWCKRENIQIGRSCVKPNENNKADDTYYTQTILPMILQDYDSDCIFNANECGLYYKAMPSALTGTDIDDNEREMRKARFTLVFICNATGTFKKVHVIGKKKITNLRNQSAPLPYFVNKNALLTSALWNEILSDLDAEMCATNKKIVLFANKISCHQITSELKNINIQFLQPTSSILIQPLDNGIIKAFKLQYREQMVKKQLCALERRQSIQEFTNKFSILNGLFLIKQTWSMMKPVTIEKFFEKSGFISHVKTDPTEIDNNSVLKLIPNKMDYIHVDDNIKCTETVSKMKSEKTNSYARESSIESISEEKNPLSDDEEVDNDIEESDSDSDRIDEDNTEIEIPTAKAALLALETLQNFCMFNNIESDSLEYIEKNICKHLIRQTRQTRVADVSVNNIL